MFRSKSFVSFTVLYFLIVCVDIFLMSYESLIVYRVFSKPAIVSALLCWLLFVINKKFHMFYGLIVGLVFSLGGDILLLLTGSDSLFFILGLSSFLIAHIFYSLMFATKFSYHRTLWVILSLLVGYASWLWSMIYKALNDLMLPVLLYIVVILVMAVMAYSRRKDVSKSSFWLVGLGALLFLISDSLLSIQMFTTSAQNLGALIMVTYGLAQFLIVVGSISGTKKKQLLFTKNTPCRLLRIRM